MERHLSLGSLVAAFVCVCVSLVIAVAPAPTVERAQAVAVELPACATEDSDNCYWDASSRGNGSGNSFVVRDGVVTFINR